MPNVCLWRPRTPWLRSETGKERHQQRRGRGAPLLVAMVAAEQAVARLYSEHRAFRLPSNRDMAGAGAVAQSKAGTAGQRRARQRSARALSPSADKPSR